MLGYFLEKVINFKTSDEIKEFIEYFKDVR